MSSNNKTGKSICDILKFEGVMSGGFGMAPRIIMRDVRLTIEAKAIYCYFQSFAGSSAVAFPKRTTILKELGMSKDRYYKHLNLLIEYDYIRIERESEDNNWKGRNVYVIVANPESENVDPPEKETKKKSVPKNEKRSSAPQKKMYQGRYLNPNRFEEVENEQHKKIKQNEKMLNKRLKVDDLITKYPEDQENIRKIYSVILDMDTSEEMKIGGSVKKKEAIQDIINQLTDRNIIMVLKSLKDNKSIIKNKRLWIQSCLLNSIYEDDDVVDRVIKKSEENRTEEISQEEAGEEDCKKQEIWKKHPYLKEREEQIKELCAEKAKAMICEDKAAVEQLTAAIKTSEVLIKLYIEEKGIPYPL